MADRRTFVRLVGVATSVGVVGCSGDGGDGDGGGGDRAPLSGDDYPTIDQWLTETEIGGADETYDGTLADRRNQDTLTIEVGAPGNDGNLAYAPSAVVVSAGTEIRWSWTSDDTSHNVQAVPNEQLEKSDYEFSSGEPEAGSGVTYNRTLRKTGRALYHCDPHLSLGMKGGIFVE